MDSFQPPSRAAFSRQPARILLIDFTPPFSPSVCQCICTGLDNLFTMVCNMTGPCRVPYFGLFALGAFSENLFPLQYVQGNYSRIQNALDELRSFQRDGFLINEKPGFLLQAVQDALQQFMKQSHTLRQTTGFASQVEVFLMTSQKSAGMIAKQIEEAVFGSFDVQNLRRIQVISLAHDSLLQLRLDSSPVLLGGSQRSSASSEGVLESGIVELTMLETDELSVQNFFNGWLHDCSTDEECLYLSFTSAVSGSPFKLTCDLQERFIDPSFLAVTQTDFTLGISCSAQQKILPGNHMKSPAALSTAIPTLQALRLVKISSICDSVVFGVPLILRPTACWKLPWDELEKNQQHFQALCHLLQEKDLAILARKDAPRSHLPPSFHGGGGYQQPTSSRSQTGPSDVSSMGHFIILPSQGMTMLVKPVAMKELMLPSDASTKGEPPLSDALENVQKVLNTLEVSDLFNPLLVPSNLHANLKKALCKVSGHKAVRRQRPPSSRAPGVGRAASRSQAPGAGRASRGQAPGTGRASRGQAVRGQRSRGGTTRGLRARGRSFTTPLRSAPKEYLQQPVVKNFEHFFPDIED